MEELIVVRVPTQPGMVCRMDHRRMLGDKYGPGIGQPGGFVSLQFNQQALILCEDLRTDNNFDLVLRL